MNRSRKMNGDARMRLRTGRLPTYLLVVTAVLALLLVVVELNLKVRIFAPFYREKKEAAELTQKLYDALREKRRADGYVIDAVNDPNGTGLIGLQHSLVTTEPGDLISKLTTVNPNFSAVVVGLLKELNLKNGDVVALSFSGSFPALNIAAIAACEVLKLKTILIVSGGASMWGANDPKFLYLDMERYLFEQGMITTRTVAASIGGVDDVGRGLSPEGRALITESMSRNRVTPIASPDVDGAVKGRLVIYEAHAGPSPIRGYLNVGGSAAALGGMDVPSGIVDRVRYAGNKGLVGEFLRRSVPVVNLDDIYSLARSNDLPVAPIPAPRSGRGRIFYETRYSTFGAGIFAGLLLFILFAVLRIDIDHYLKELFAGRSHRADDGPTKGSADAEKEKK